MLTPTLTLNKTFVNRAATLDDVEALAAMLNACSRAQVGRDEFTVDGLRNDLQMPGFNLETDSQAVLTRDGRLAGYVDVTSHRPMLPFVWGRVHPDFEGQGIGAYLMQWGEERARQAIAQVEPDVRVALQANVISTHEPTRRLFAGCGLRVIRRFYRMVIDFEGAPAEPEWPAGISVRTAVKDAEERAIYQTVYGAFRDHWGHVDRPIEQAFEQWLHMWNTEQPYDPALWFLAMDSNQIVGVSLCRSHLPEDPDMGWVGQLGVLRPWRRKGVALALLQHSFGELYRLGRKRVGLGVDADSLTGATRLYERAGMRVARQYDLYEKELRPGRDAALRSVEAQG